jgi:hypothetical protein
MLDWPLADPKAHVFNSELSIPSAFARACAPNTQQTPKIYETIKAM